MSLDPAPTSDPAPAARIAEILVSNHLMTLATVRSDGWPHASIVNYLADGLALHFMVSRTSQKMTNILRDPRVSIAIVQDDSNGVRGLSMAAHVQEVDPETHIEALDRRIWLASGKGAFSPHPTGRDVAVLRATPTLVSLIEYDQPKAQARLFSVAENWSLIPVDG